MSQGFLDSLKQAFLRLILPTGLQRREQESDRQIDVIDPLERFENAIRKETERVRREREAASGDKKND